MSGTTGAGFGATAVESPVPNGRWFHVLVPVMVLCIVSYMDRTNIGFAIPGGMSKDLAMSASFAGLAAGIFFIGYLFLQVPGGTPGGSSRPCRRWYRVPRRFGCHSIPRRRPRHRP